MQKKVRPVSLRPMTREQKRWLAATIFLFVVFMAVGWYFTVARVLQKSFKDSQQTISVKVDQTKQQFIGEDDLGQKSQETFDKMKAFFEQAKQTLENKQKAEQAILDNVKEELKQTSTQ
ncbi:hypothetical protein A2318_04170 [Candidatus Uhrbacteria bacterium RIFOXYB2_FULL_45_11]|uniref:Uncharacterized protein n=1 Tax=Candidatus Uhrbacteria bacterium RIFOXYB2_FULL_45_11 TaxID=1802421 RepID=A0A1F7W1Y7_9BACT|nr:MAG: hypothetical protein A2318_04170 [Candidatus Uhrbacteria bacterium RIFOXYB2_FULL_45_11]